MTNQQITTVEEAIACLRSSGYEVSKGDSYWYVYITGPDDAEAGWTCATDADLIADGRLEQSIMECLQRESRERETPTSGYSSPKQQTEPTRQALLSEWTCVPTSGQTQEVKA